MNNHDKKIFFVIFELIDQYSTLNFSKDVKQLKNTSIKKMSKR